MEARRPIPEGWLAVVRARLPYVAALPPAERERLLHHARSLLTTLRWEGANGLVLTDDMRLVIAAQAALLTWKRSDLPFPRLKTVVVYPTTFRPRPAFAWVAGPPSHERESPTLGQSWSDGTIVLAWDDVLHGAAAPHDGHNVVCTSLPTSSIPSTAWLTGCRRCRRPLARRPGSARCIGPMTSSSARWPRAPRRRSTPTA